MAGLKVLVTYAGNHVLVIDRSNPEPPFKVGQQYMIEAKSASDRSVAHHRKFWAMLRYFAEFLDKPISDRLLLSWVLLGAGWYELTPDGRQVPVSVAFANMGQAEFDRLYNAALDYLLEHVGPDHMTREDVETALLFA